MSKTDVNRPDANTNTETVTKWAERVGQAALDLPPREFRKSADASTGSDAE